MFLHSCTSFIFQKTPPNLEIFIHFHLPWNFLFSTSRLSLCSPHGNIIPALIFSLVRCWGFFFGVKGVVEGRTFLFKSVHPGLDWAQFFFCLMDLAWLWHYYWKSVMTFIMMSQDCVQVPFFTDPTPIITNVGLTPKLAFSFTKSNQ